MTTIEPILPGLYARSEALVTASRDHDRDRIEDAELADQQRRDLEALIGAQQVAGFQHLATGQLPWQDLFRPFAAIVEGLEPRTLVRFLDTNTFYRRPDIPGELAIRPDALGAFFEAFLPPVVGQRGVATFPAPSAFVTGAANEDGTYPDASIATRLAEALYPTLLREANACGHRTVVLSDPWLSSYPDPAALIGSFDAALPGDNAPTVFAQVPFQDAAPILADVAQTGIDGVLVDLTLTDLPALAAVPATKAIGLGVVDARSSLVERADLLAATATRAAEEHGHEAILLAPSGDLQHVPEAIARRKVRALGEAARFARDKLGGGPE